MINLLDLLETIRQTPSCTVLPPSGLPTFESELVLPPDVRTFYENAGGVKLFQHEGWSNRVVTPTEFVQADLAFFGERRLRDGPERSWYTVADVQDGNYVLIDLNPTRLGRCYDGFHETYGQPGYMKVIANSFTEMLQRMYELGNNGSYWLEDGFPKMGEAYDP